MYTLLKLNTSLFRQLTKNILMRLDCWNSTGNILNANYSIKEVKIPMPKGHYISGKLWTRNENSQNQNNLMKTSVPIICVHGWLDNAGSFDPLLSKLLEEENKNLTILAIDLPGHGYSSHCALTHYDTFQDGMISILRTIDFMKWQKVTLISHSLGSVLSFIFTGIFPEYVNSYIALDVLHPIPLETIKSLRRVTKSILDIEKKLVNDKTPSYTFEEILKRTFDARNGTVTEEGCKILLKRGCKQLPDGKYSFTHDLRVTILTGAGRFTEEESRIIGSKIICPVCVIKGEQGSDYEPRGNFMQGVEHVKKYSKYLEFHLIPGTHHFHLNTPHLVAPIISKFLDVNI